MPYPREIYNKAMRRLEARRDDAVMKADILKQEIMEELPRVAEIQRGLAQIGLEISRLFLYRDNTQEKVAEIGNTTRDSVRRIRKRKNNFPHLWGKVHLKRAFNK